MSLGALFHQKQRDSHELFSYGHIGVYRVVAADRRDRLQNLGQQKNQNTFLGRFGVFLLSAGPGPVALSPKDGKIQIL